MYAKIALAKNGLPYIVLMGDNHEPMFTGEMYTESRNILWALDALKDFDGTRVVVDELVRESRPIIVDRVGAWQELHTPDPDNSEEPF